MSRRTLRIALVALSGAAVLALAACATPAAPAGTPEPASEDAALNPKPVVMGDVSVGWAGVGNAVAVVTLGSSTCLPTAGEPARDADGAVLITLIDPADTACTADLVPRATLAAVPEDVDPTADALVRIVWNDEKVDLPLTAVPAISAGDYESAAYRSGGDRFTVLTWGSSSCAPIVDTVNADGSVIAVTFAEQPADRMCTMDMAPRITPVQLDAAALETAETVTIQGGMDFPEPREVALHG